MSPNVDVVPLEEDPTEAVVAREADPVDLAGMARAVDRVFKSLCKLLLCEPVIPSRPSLRLPDAAALECCGSLVPMLAGLSNAS